MDKILGIVETDLFGHRVVQPHFINRCCFGEDLGDWLRGQLGHLAQHGFEIRRLIQEDYGWGFWIARGRSRFWVALSYVGDGPTEEPGKWGVTVSHAMGFLARALGRADPDGLRVVVESTHSAFEEADGIEWWDEDA